MALLCAGNRRRIATRACCHDHCVRSQSTQKCAIYDSIQSNINIKLLHLPSEIGDQFSVFGIHNRGEKDCATQIPSLLSKCDAMPAQGRYTRDLHAGRTAAYYQHMPRLFSGRNLDWLSDSGINAHKYVVNWRPVGGIAHAVVGFAGLQGALTGMSAAGLTVHEANLESDRDSFLGFPWTLRLRDLMERAGTLPEATDLWGQVWA